MDWQKETELIERYLNYELSQPELQAFETRLKGDPSFRKMVENQRFISDAMAGTGHFELEDTLRTSRKEEKGVRYFFRWKWAAVIIPFLAAGLWWIVSLNSLDRTVNQLYISPAPALERTEGDSDLELAMTAFGRQDFATSVELFSKIPADDPDYKRARYFQAHALYRSENWSDARVIFLGLSADDEPGLRQQAAWFAILAGIKSNVELQTVAQELSMISNNPDHFYQKQAQELLDEL